VVTDGWGNADVGGAWYSGGGPNFRVDGSRGVITVWDTRTKNVVGIGPVHGSPDMQGYGLDVGGLLAFQLDTPPDGTSSRHNIHVYARRNDRLTDGDNSYLFRVRPSRSSIELRIYKEVDDETSSLTSTVTIPGAFDPAGRWWIRWEVFGASPATTLRLRVWKDGTAEPTSWHRSVVVNEPRLDVSGATGVRFGAATDQVTFPVSLYVDDLQYTRLGEPPPPNQAPVANPGGPYGGAERSAMQFDGSASSDPDGNLPLSYAWTFGDGSTGTGVNPTHSYAVAGTFTVSLTVTDANGLASATASTTATISSAPNEAPVANAGGPYTGTAGSAVQFDGSGSSDPDGNLPLTYAWNFGDGGTATAPTPTHTYASAGTYTVTLTVRDARGLSSAGDTTSATVAERPNQTPVAKPGGPYSGIPGTAVQLNGTASSDPDGNLPLTYSWNFGDGTTGTGATPTHTYNAAGTFIISLTVTDAKGLSSSPATVTATISSVLRGDTFSRVVSQGWGNAEVGGAWYAQPASAFSVDGARGVITAVDSYSKNIVGIGPFHGATETPDYGLNVAGLVSFRIDRAPDGSSSKHTLHVYARRNDRVGDGDFYYRFRVRPSRTALELRIEKTVNNVNSNLTDATSISATFDAAAKWWIRWEVFGVSPATTVRFRVWKDGSPEPTVWHRSAVVNEPALDVSGTTGVRFAVPSDQTSYPVHLYIDDLQYTVKGP
jgi:PKD repeat protein